MKSQTIPRTLRAVVAAASLVAAAAAGAQADNTNSATDPTYYDAWYGFHPVPTTPYWRDSEFNEPRRYAYGPATHSRGPAYYESWRYYDSPPRYYASPSVTPLGTVTQPGYMGPRDVRP
jgi:hypothetical protein